MANMLSDDELIRQALQGRQTAYSMMVKRYEHFVFTLCMRMVKNREEAHEVAQDAFVRAFRYLPDFRGDSKFSTWLYKIVYTTCLNHLRKNHPESVSLDDVGHPVALPDDGTPDASAAIMQAERNTTLKNAIQHLSADDATIITLFYLYEQTLDEICQITGLTMSNAKTKLSRARQRLKGVIEADYRELITSHG